MNFRNYKSVAERRKALEKELKIELSAIGDFSLDEKIASMKNCENMIGATQIPLGIAGPLRIEKGELKVENYSIPLATTEGALVASINRGCKVISEAG
ncbi:MAG TPA: 3-hydroxy-3-methylglutaryl-CoA reductase, partial [Patescibacteria group bacterium]